MRYTGTRKDSAERSFKQVQLQSMAPDGGLYQPTHLPQYSLEEIRTWQGLAYHELAAKLIAPFIGDAIDPQTLQNILKDAYGQAFDQSRIAPLRPLRNADNEEHVLELFHGPTLSFKDYALQVSGRLLGALLDGDKRALVMGSTSGDTGSAAIAGYRGLNNIDIVILHPHERVSEIQRRQMTTETAPNVHNLALKGDYDACQAIVKLCLNDESLSSPELMRVTVNSINWARIMLQTVYYFAAFLNLGAPEKGVYFSVPTGNFGNIYAAHLARGMGVPIPKLIAGVNPNSVLPKFFDSGVYTLETERTTKSLAPSMDIAIPSNLERLLFDLVEHDGEILADKMRIWREQGTMDVGQHATEILREGFACHFSDDDMLCETIAEIYRSEDGYMIDPHSAAAVSAGRRWASQSSEYDGAPIVHVATADPVKFPDAVKRALNLEPKMSEATGALLDSQEHYQVLDADADAVRQYITSKCL
jgi:threonine synthase